MECNTLYIKNLNERIKIDELKKSLHAVFGQFGEIVDIIVKKNLKMHGQAFLAFKERESAVSAVNGMQGFPLYDKPLKIQFAKCDSDCVAKLLGTYVEKVQNVTKEKTVKKKKNSNNKNRGKKVLQTLPLKNQQQVSNNNFTSSHNLLNQPSAVHPGFMVENLPPPIPVVEPPNNILFVTNLPLDTNQMTLTALFINFPGFKEIRTVPSRPDIAFVEFSEVSYAKSAKDYFQNFILGSNVINITFAKK